MAWLHGKSQQARNDELCGAAERGDVGEVERLIAEGADVHALVLGWTPLQWAVIYGRVPAIAALLKAGAHVDGAGGDGWTPLMLAASRSQTAALEALIAAGANGNRPRNDGNTALHDAARCGHLDGARVLLKGGATADVRNNEGQRPIDVVRIRRDCDRSLDVARENG